MHSLSPAQPNHLRLKFPIRWLSKSAFQNLWNKWGRKECCYCLTFDVVRSHLSIFFSSSFSHHLSPSMLHSLGHGSVRLSSISLQYSTCLRPMHAPRENEERLIFERELIGKDVVNVIGCEGFERVERPETCKQWQSRNYGIRFKQFLLDKNLLKRVKAIEKSFHEDFIVDEDGDWMLLGWKGRIIQALSAWKPVHN